jgi:hypothetical protein
MLPTSRSHLAFAFGAHTGVRSITKPIAATASSNLMEKMLVTVADHETVRMAGSTSLNCCGVRDRRFRGGVPVRNPLWEIALF